MVDKTFDECIYGGLFFIEIWMCVIEKHWNDDMRWTYGLVLDTNVLLTFEGHWTKFEQFWAKSQVSQLEHFFEVERQILLHVNKQYTVKATKFEIKFSKIINCQNNLWLI